MYEKLDLCPLCGHTKFTNYMICDDHTVTAESFALVKCEKCTLVFTNPRPTLNELSKYYQSSEYISHTDRANSLFHIIYKLVRNYTLRQKSRLVTSISNGQGKILDYGCGTGDFLKAMLKQGWEGHGYEPDVKAASIANAKTGESIISTIDKIDNNYDVITAWHVIEHVSELLDTMRKLKKALKAEGHLIIAVPNYQSYDAQYYREYWAAYDVPRHLYHFDRTSMKELARLLKLKLVDTIPMKFDSYYVSMLSEKYKNGGHVMRAAKIGYQSNHHAKRSNEYSSLIYILKK